jgi:citrate lyase subunit beta/citryl-CoA lyase
MRRDLRVVPGGPIARRSCLSVPASSPRKLAKAVTTEADEVVIDLEDSVARGAKVDARAATIAVLSDWGGGTVAVRVNATGSPWCHADIAALGAAVLCPLSIVVPKVESAGDLAFVERLLDGVESAVGRVEQVRVQALIETASGLSRAGEISASSGRLDALILGYADLAASLGRTTVGVRDLDGWLYAQDTLLVAARANGLQAIDGPHLGTRADERFLDAARRTRDLGFDGKWAIHPSQLGVLNELFTPSGAELAHARAVISALDRAARDRGQGAVRLDGEMLDEAVRSAAERVLARAHAAG